MSSIVSLFRCSPHSSVAIPRISAQEYIPTEGQSIIPEEQVWNRFDDAADILKAQVKTVRVVEHTFSSSENEEILELSIFDVDGTRSQRQTWAPYFDDGEWCPLWDIPLRSPLGQ